MAVARRVHRRVRMENEHDSKSDATSLSHTHRYSSVDPQAHLPELSTIGSLDDEARRQALSKWVSWFNGNRFAVPPDLERRIDEALEAFERDQASPSPNEVEEIQDDFDDWLDGLGEDGRFGPSDPS